LLFRLGSLPFFRCTLPTVQIRDTFFSNLILVIPHRIFHPWSVFASFYLRVRFSVSFIPFPFVLARVGPDFRPPLPANLGLPFHRSLFSVPPPARYDFGMKKFPQPLGHPRLLQPRLPLFPFFFPSLPSGIFPVLSCPISVGPALVNHKSPLMLFVVQICLFLRNHTPSCKEALSFGRNASHDYTSFCQVSFCVLCDPDKYYDFSCSAASPAPPPLSPWHTPLLIRAFPPTVPLLLRLFHMSCRYWHSSMRSKSSLHAPVPLFCL